MSGKVLDTGYAAMNAMNGLHGIPTYNVRHRSQAVEMRC